MNLPEEPRKEQGNSTMLMETGVEVFKNQGSAVNSGRRGSIMPLESTTIILKEIMTALTQPNIVTVGIYGANNANRENVVEKVSRRVERDGLFNMIVKTSVTKKPDLKSIQGKLGNALGLQLHEKTLEERATRLCERIKMEDKILIILDDLQGEINLIKIGIPFGNDHKGCKILLVAENKDVLLDKMKTQKEFYVDELMRSPWDQASGIILWIKRWWFSLN